MNNPTPKNRYHTLVVLVENKAGVLARVAGLFARRGFNIESLAVAPTDDDRFSRITIVVDAASASLDQIVKQLDKLINVVEIHLLDPAFAVEREFMLATVSVPPADRPKIRVEQSGFDVYILAETQDSVMLSFSGRADRVDELEDLLRPYGITEIQRTGKVALSSL